jgi:hypothetical protein
LPQFGSLIPAADNVEVTGKAMCGFCYWSEGGKSCNVVLKTITELGVVFLSPNEKVNEIEKITGKCANGKVEIKARGIPVPHAMDSALLSAPHSNDKMI